MVSHDGGNGILISDAKIRQAKAKSTAYQLSDERGLLLLVKPTGGKLWRWNYRHKRTQKTMSFGQYPDVPLAEARERLAEARRLLAAGVDPMEQRKIVKTSSMVADAESFQTVAHLWMDHWKAEKSAQHVDAIGLHVDSP